MEQGITYVGLDVHKDSITGAALPPGFDECQEEQTLPCDFGRLRKWLKRLERKWGELRICYEASGAGYVLYHYLTERGFLCEVVAPSLIPKKPGDHRKTDRRDARKLAVLYRAGALTMVRVPDREDEALRALVRCRRGLGRDVNRARHQVLKHTRRNGEVYRETKNNWTKRHWVWLKALELPLAHEQFVLQTLLEKLEYLEAKLEEVEERIAKEAFEGQLAERASRLMCLRGVAVTGAAGLGAEIGDFQRFPGAKEFMDYVGLTPSEYSSGQTTRRGGITKAGNSHCRHLLVQAAWVNVKRMPRVSARLRAAWKGQPPWVVALAQRAMKRLHSRYWYLVSRGKVPQVAITAVARELAGFVWAIMQDKELESSKSAA
jgi:transposase